MCIVAAVGVLNLFKNSPPLLERFEEQTKSVRVTTMSEGYGGSDELEFPPEKSDLIYCQRLSRPDSFDLLRRLAASLLESGALPAPADLSKTYRPDDDPAFIRFKNSKGLAKRKLLERTPNLISRSFSHLAAHNGINGYYSPRPFDEILEPAGELEFEGGALGSAPKLSSELERIAAALELPLELMPDSEQVTNALRERGRGVSGWERRAAESQALLALYHGANRSFETQRTLALVEIP